MTAEVHNRFSSRMQPSLIRGTSHSSASRQTMPTNFAPLAHAKSWVPIPTNLAPLLMDPAYPTANSSPARLLCTALSTRSAALPSSEAKYKLLVASRQAQHHAQPMAALHLLAQQLLPRPRVPLHFCKEAFKTNELMLGRRYVFTGIRGHSHLYFLYLSFSL